MPGVLMLPASCLTKEMASNPFCSCGTAPRSRLVFLGGWRLKNRSVFAFS